MLVNYIIIFVILISLAILYQKYIEKKASYVNVDDYGEIKKYLLKDKLSKAINNNISSEMVKNMKLRYSWEESAKIIYNLIKNKD